MKKAEKNSGREKKRKNMQREENKRNREINK